MRLIAAIAAAAVLAGFTVQDAEKALDGEWSARVFAIGLEINAASATAILTDAGKQTSGPFKVVSVSGGAATVSIGTTRYVLHVRDGGKTLLFAREGKADAISMQRVR